MLLGGRSAARGRCVARRRAPRALPHTGRAELVFKAVCARARTLAIVRRHEMSHHLPHLLRKLLILNMILPPVLPAK